MCKISLLDKSEEYLHSSNIVCHSNNTYKIISVLHQYLLRSRRASVIHARISYMLLQSNYLIIDYCRSSLQ